MRVALLGAGTIARLVLDHLRRGELPGMEITAVAGRGLRPAAGGAAARSAARLYVPSGGIGGLDALKAACAAGVDEVSIQVAKPPAAWKGIAYVEARRIDLDRLKS